MTNKTTELNPLDALKMRRAAFCPPHFEVTFVTPRYNIEEALCKWIVENCSGRFFVGHGIILDTNETVIPQIKVGFERPSELSYFMLACSLLKY